MALYYGLLHEWIRLGAFVRTLSVLMALGSIGAVYILGKRMFGARVALLKSYGPVDEEGLRIASSGSPNDFTNPGEIAARILAFQAGYEQAAQPFEWKFTRDDLGRLMKKLAAQARRPAARWRHGIRHRTYDPEHYSYS